MKVLVINCGSSSLKYQLIDMDGEKVLCKGLCERIGMESSMITHEANGHKATTPAIFPTHTEAFAEVVKKMTTGEGKCINDVSEIDAIGHRVVHGGEKFKSSCLITDEVIETLRELSPQALLQPLGDVNGVQIPLRFWHNVSSDDLVSQSLPLKMARHRASREERPARSPAPCRAHHYVLWFFIIPCEYARGKTCIAICLLLRIQT